MQKTTKFDEIKDLQYKKEKLDFENFLKNLAILNVCYRKKNKNINKKKILLNITEISKGTNFTLVSSTFSIFNTTIAIPIASSFALFTLKPILKTSEYVSKLKLGYVKIRDWINIISLLYEKTMKKSIV